MSDASQHLLCPCRSGIYYSACCGVPDRKAINADIMARIAANGGIAQGGLTPPVEQALQSVDASPDLFPARIQFAEDKAYFVKMSPQWYRDSVFLDPARIKGTYVIEANLQWTKTIAQTTPLRPIGFIFHTAFCGSTLMAQALDALFDCLPLREPEALGNLLFYIRSPKVPDRQWLERVTRLLSRSYQPEQYVVVKANDNANPLMIDLLAWRGDLPILFMYTPLSEFLAGCLKADNRRAWIRQRFNAVRSNAQDLLTTNNPLDLDDNAFGEMAAVYWSYNIALYYRARQRAATRLRSLDFNQMLAHPLQAIEACASLLGLRSKADVDVNNEINKLFGVYSKNANFKYSPQQRNKDIQQVLDEHRDHLEAAEKLAKELLKENYPERQLPGGLLD
jgi:hypothetical protein